MFGKRCSLCNGKLDSRNICKECGLDNTKSDKYYKMNRSDCDGMPLTHVHEDARLETKQQKYSYQSTPVSKKQEKRKKKNEKKGKFSIFISILVVVLGIIPSLISLFENVTDSSSEPEYYADGYNPYVYIEDYIEKEHPEDGERLVYTMESGQYIVGVHIAEGNYSATVQNDYDSVAVTDEENGIYLYEYQAQEGNFLDDLRLFNGAVVTIESAEGVVLQTENGQTQTQVNATENPLEDNVVLEPGQEYEVGWAFDAGVYDVYNFSEYGYVNLTIIDEDGEEWDIAGYDIGQEDLCGTCFRNMVLLDGMRIYVEGATMELEPSGMISSEGYDNYYAGYY